MTEPTQKGPLPIRIDYDAERVAGALTIDGDPDSAIWIRIRLSALTQERYEFPDRRSILLPWTGVLSIVRKFIGQQKILEFRFKPTPEAMPRIQESLTRIRNLRAARHTSQPSLDEAEVEKRLRRVGFTRRTLRQFQMRDLKRLLQLDNGANFSVPGAGKTTVTLALHLLTRMDGQKLLVVSPKSAFAAWTDVVGECIADDAPEWVKEPFSVLTGGADAIRQGLHSDATRFVTNYEQLLVIPELFESYLALNAVHLVLDEAHRMKGGYLVRRGAVLLNMAPLPVRRDILTGTPMPQSPSDLVSQLNFLWPGADLGLKIAGGAAPRDVIGNLYVRTTKSDLELPPIKRHFKTVEMGKGQSALYAVVRDAFLRDRTSLRTGSGYDLRKARRSVMRLLQLSANPVMAVNAMTRDDSAPLSGIMQQVLDDGPSPKMLAVRDFARELAADGRKTVIWSIFTDTIEQMERMLADLQPVTVYGDIPSGEATDPSTREGRIRRFHEDAACRCLIANPAAAGEGINLHQCCHDAIYLDRSYNATHYLQSIDRIHRLGLPPDIETNVHIFQTMAPKELGCIDYSVSRRLATKLRAMQQLLDDKELHQIALDEEQGEPPIDFGTDREDLIDLVDELEGLTTYDKKVGR